MAALAGRVALVTGAGSGIGAAIAAALAQAGASVALAGRRQAPLDEGVAAIAGDGGDAIALRCDVTDPASVADAFAELDRRLGPLDILVNNAGTLALAPCETLNADQWDRVLNTNLRGAFLCAQQAFRRMMLRGSGRIVNIGSLSALRVRPGNLAYNVSKFGLEGLTQSLALEGRAHGIACSILHPGNTLSDITSDPGFPEKLMPAAEVARIAVLMCTLPPDVNLLQAVVLPVEQPFLGRG